MLRLKICVQMQLKRIKYIPDRYWTNKCRSSHPEVFLLIVVLANLQDDTYGEVRFQ